VLPLQDSGPMIKTISLCVSNLITYVTKIKNLITYNFSYLEIQADFQFSGIFVL